MEKLLQQVPRETLFHLVHKFIEGTGYHLQLASKIMLKEQEYSAIEVLRLSRCLLIGFDLWQEIYLDFRIMTGHGPESVEKGQRSKRQTKQVETSSE
jgi:hypothetical protein